MLGRVRGIGECQNPEQQSIILLEQERDGIHWNIAADIVVAHSDRLSEAM